MYTAWTPDLSACGIKITLEILSMGLFSCKTSFLLQALCNIARAKDKCSSHRQRETSTLVMAVLVRHMQFTCPMYHVPSLKTNCILVTDG
jgi:hypothetical protein